MTFAFLTSRSWLNAIRPAVEYLETMYEGLELFLAKILPGCNTDVIR